MQPEEARSFEATALIDVADEHQLRYWAERFEATPDEISRAVETVGPNRTAVALWLGRGDAAMEA